MTQQNQIHLASLADFDELKSLMVKANQHSFDRSGLPLWTMIDYVHGQFERQIKRKECYILRNAANEITSCIVLTEEGPEWGEMGEDGQAIYFHKWMKDPQKANSGESQRMLLFAAEETMRRGKKYLRCDTVPSLVSLIKYYDRLGFRRVKLFVYESSNRPGMLLEADAENLTARLGSA